ncbi:hypothetical protein PTKIN_Ptkin04bG0213300 [Pterospermum kingtungense]
MDQNQNQIHHFLHTHPLVLLEDNFKVDCRGCHTDKPDPIYGCSVCKFYLHEHCAKLPAELQNYFHSCRLVLSIGNHICNACFAVITGFGYGCKRCDFNMHVECALRPTMESQGEELFHHFTHWHPLSLVDQNNKDLNVQCRICYKVCSDSSDSPVYGCNECKFFAHKSCMINTPRQIDHCFHQTCTLILLICLPFTCRGCGDEDDSHMAFTCGKCRYQLDAKCALLPTVESKGAHMIQHTSHNHPLQLHENVEPGRQFRCRACGEYWLGPYFVCKKCRFYIHKLCALDHFPQKIQHPFHQQHLLSLSTHPDRSYNCDVCGGSGDRSLLLYRCVQCDFNIHSHCSKLKPTPLLKYGGHSHYLYFFDRTLAPFSCNICGNKAQNCFLRCVTCKFNIHLYCLPSAPKTIEHKYHLHPLTLTSSPFEFELNSSEDEYNSNDEFYCDVCEEKRYKFESVYYCEECRFIADIRCVISEVCFP